MDIDKRPVLASSGGVTPVVDLVAELQSAIDRSDAVQFNARFAADVLWGTPFGGLVGGYDEIHAIHQRMFGSVEPSPGASTYVIDTARRLTDEVAIAYVRRFAREHAADEQPGRADAFDELALFVLVRRDGAWWLAAGQHVPDRRGEAYGEVVTKS